MTRARPLVWGVLVLLLGSVAACGPQVAPTLEPLAVDQEPTPVLPAADTSPNITVFNSSSTAICFLFISPTNAPAWGDDWLRGMRVEAGGSLALPVAPDTYDVKAEDCDGRVLHSTRALGVQGPVTWTVIFSGGPAVQFTLLNNSGATICHLLISPSTADGWGNDWLGTDETLVSGASVVLEVPGGTYDLRAQDCDQNPVSEQMAVPLDAAYTWDVR